ncbi:6-hydroxy-D-nicotine oxidase-like protein [Hapsidospora chrysogenum ATCC 11550]|uniref:6-hydroxy-D-nicotine oxidase-like protein n=1 Tax=Hapsidospora chrysogenum (strain ATCC 11550 / CBS 779.69 / DSM 880 / IAM 14645 / JCM 23072 / IMI 49137) TaxID=857340 RepID=A0A086T4U5_HAPC1|nr:6-hydroxy-D-nicotine oxidase-like protein [Hapsidospora chrysogenum ATCC 11550]
MYTLKLPWPCLLTLLLVGAATHDGNSVWAKRTTAFQTRSTAGKSSSPECRCFPGDACWPAPSAWNALNESVSGHLVATVPIGSVCHGDTYDADACGAIQAAWTTAETHTDSSSSVLVPYFANQSCDPFLPRDAPCVVGTYVQYAVGVSGVSDIQSTLSFARENNIRLVVRNTGHDYFGKSTGAGALGVWTHHLKDFDVLDYSSPLYTGKAIRMGAGVQAGDAAAKAFAEGLTLVAGVCPTVGLAGGYTQGGGLGPLTSKYGFGADQVLEWRVVLADGSDVVATPDRHPDLYWALSGGGGGTYGVVYSMTVKAHPNELTTAANLSFSNNGSNDDTFFKAVGAFHAVVPALSDAGGTALWTVQSRGFSLGPVTAPGVTKETLDSILEPVLLRLQYLGIPYSYSSAEFPSYHESNLAYNPPGSTPGVQIGGRLVPRSVFTGNEDGFNQAVRKIVGQGAAVTGVSFTAPNEVNFDNSVNPELRNSMISFQVGTLWNHTDWELNLRNQDLITNTFIPSLADLIPGGGSAYLNQADFREPDWQQVFYGETYETLLQAKARYDPDDLFWGMTAVGSDRWAETEDKRLCRVS